MKILQERESVKVGKASIKLATAEFVSIIFGAFYFLFITRTFTKIEIASLAVLSIIMSLSGLLNGFGLHATVVKLIPGYIAGNERKKIAQFLQGSYMLILVTSLILTLLALIFARQISQVLFKAEEFHGLIRIMAFSIFSNKFYETTAHNLTAFQKFAELSLSQIASNVIIRIFAIFLYFSNGIEGYLVGLITGQFLLACWMFFQIRIFIFRKVHFFSLKETLRYSFPFYLNSYIGYGANYGDSLIAGLFLQPEVLAIYYVARRFIDYLEIFINAVLKPVFPKMLELKSQGMEIIGKVFYKSTRYLSLVLIPVVFLIISLSYFLLNIYGKGKYLSGLPVLIALGFASIFTGFYSLLMGTIFVTRNPIETTKIEAAKSLVNILGGLVLIKNFGIIGLVIGKSAAVLTGFVIGHLFISRFLKFRYDVPFIKKITFISVLCASIVGIPQIFHYQTFMVVLYAITGVSMFFLLSKKIFIKEDFNLMKELLVINH